MKKAKEREVVLILLKRVFWSTTCKSFIQQNDSRIVSPFYSEDYDRDYNRYQCSISEIS